MEDKEQTPPVQVPTEENNFKHIDTPSEGGTDDKSGEGQRPKNDADSNDDNSPVEILQKEKIIDPGNEHHHQADEPIKDANVSSRQNNDTGSNDTATKESEHGEGKNDEPTTSGETS